MVLNGLIKAQSTSIIHKTILINAWKKLYIAKYGLSIVNKEAIASNTESKAPSADGINLPPGIRANNSSNKAKMSSVIPGGKYKSENGICGGEKRTPNPRLGGGTNAGGLSEFEFGEHTIIYLIERPGILVTNRPVFLSFAYI